MKKQYIAIALFAIVALTSCKKAIEAAATTAITNQIVNGKWLVTSYMEGTNNITSSFTGWEARFFDGGTFTSTKGTEIVNGTWSGDIFAQTFTSTYTTTPVPSPLQKIAGTWKVVSADSLVGKYKRYEPSISDTARMTMTRY